MFPNEQNSLILSDSLLKQDIFKTFQLIISQGKQQDYIGDFEIVAKGKAIDSEFDKTGTLKYFDDISRQIILDAIDAAKDMRDDEQFNFVVTYEEYEYVG